MLARCILRRASIAIDARSVCNELCKMKGKPERGEKDIPERDRENWSGSGRENESEKERERE